MIFSLPSHLSKGESRKGGTFEKRKGYFSTSRCTIKLALLYVSGQSFVLNAAWASNLSGGGAGGVKDCQPSAIGCHSPIGFRSRNIKSGKPISHSIRLVPRFRKSVTKLFRDVLNVVVSSPHTPPFLRKGRGRKRGTKGQKAKERREEKKVFGLAETRPLLGLTCVSIFASSPAREVEESGEKESFTHQRPHHLSCPQVSPPFLPPYPYERAAPEGKEIT